MKAPLKRAFSGLVSEEVIKREKVGFPVPIKSLEFPGASGSTGYDRFLDFNLGVLGIEREVEV